MQPTPAQSWRIDRKLFSAALDAAGAGAVVIRNDNPAALWIVVQLSLVTSPTISGATAAVSPPIGFVDTSYFAGTGDTAPGMYFLFPSDSLTVAFTSGPANGQGTVTMVYIEVIQ